MTKGEKLRIVMNVLRIIRLSYMTVVWIGAVGYLFVVLVQEGQLLVVALLSVALVCGAALALSRIKGR